MWSRREFLATTAAAAFAGPVVGQAALMSQAFRFATYTGALERTTGCHVIDQLERAAELGFAAFVDPQLLSRSEQEIQAIRLAAATRPIELGPVDGPTYHGPDDFRVRPAGVEGSEKLSDPFTQARRVGVSTVRCSVGPAMMAVPDDVLTLWSIDATTRFHPGQTLLFEPWDDGRGGRAVFDRCVARIRWLDDPRVRLSLNVDPLRATGASVVEFVAQHTAILGHVELRTVSGHEEVLEALSRAGYTGLVALTQPLDDRSVRSRSV